MKRLLLELYLISSLFILVAGMLMGRLLTQMEHDHAQLAAPATTPSLVSSPPLSKEAAAGNVLFRNRCASCHNENMKNDLTGPALAGTSDRWSLFPLADLRAWIRNSQKLAATGHPRAKQLLKTWKGAVMPAQDDLSDQQIDQLIAYIGSK